MTACTTQMSVDEWIAIVMAFAFIAFIFGHALGSGSKDRS